MVRNNQSIVRFPLKEAPNTTEDAYMGFPDLPVSLDLSECVFFIRLYDENDPDGTAGHIEIKRRFRREQDRSQDRNQNRNQDREPARPENTNGDR